MKLPRLGPSFSTFNLLANLSLTSANKLRQLEKDPEVLQEDFLEIALKVFNIREGKARRENEKEKDKYGKT